MKAKLSMHRNAYKHKDTENPRSDKFLSLKHIKSYLKKVGQVRKKEVNLDVFRLQAHDSDS